MIALLLTLAHATSTTDASAMLAVEGLPDPFGRSHERALLDLSLHHDAGPLLIEARGGVRQWTSPELGGMPAVQRLGLVWTPGDLELVAGRLVARDERGAQRLDGLFAEATSPSGALSGAAWAGRTWRPERFGGETFVAGGEARLHPGRLGHTPLWVGGALGAEARVADGLRGRVYAAAAGKTPRGDHFGLIGEVDPTQLDRGAQAVRAGADATVMVGGDCSLVADVAWHGMRPHAVPDDEISPMDWVAPEGYGIAHLGARWTGSRPFSVTFAPMLRPEKEGGTTAGADVLTTVRLVDGSLPLDLFAEGASVGTSRMIGGGLSAIGHVGEVHVMTSGGLWEWRGLNEVAALVGEVRGRVDVPVGHTGLTVRGQVAAGSDRVLAPWVRGGVAIIAEAHRGRGGTE